MKMASLQNIVLPRPSVILPFRKLRKLTNFLCTNFKQLLQTLLRQIAAVEQSIHRDVPCLPHRVTRQPKNQP